MSILMKHLMRPIVILSVLLLVVSAGYSQKVRLRSEINPACDLGARDPLAKFSDIFADGNIAVQGSYNCRGVFIYDISDPDRPVLASVYNPAPVQQFLEAIVIGNRGYFGAGST